MSKFKTNEFQMDLCLNCKTHQYFEEIDDIVCCPNCDAYLLMVKEYNEEYIDDVINEECELDIGSGYWDTYSYFILEKIIHV